MTVEVPVRKLLGSVRGFDGGGGPSNPRGRGGGWFDFLDRSPLRRLEIVFGNLLVLHRVSLLGGSVWGNITGIALNKLLFLDLGGNVHIRLGEFPFVRGWIRGGHVDVTAGIRTGLAFSHRFPSDC